MCWVDFLPQPSEAISQDIYDVQQHIIDRVKIAASVTMKNIHRVKLNGAGAQVEPNERYAYQDMEYIVTIGTTLGGPNTVINFMTMLPSSLPMTIVVIQEIAPKILPAFAKPFADQTAWRVEAGEAGKELEQGVCYICCNESRMLVARDEKILLSLQTIAGREASLIANSV